MRVSFTRMSRAALAAVAGIAAAAVVSGALTGVSDASAATTAPTTASVSLERHTEVAFEAFANTAASSAAALSGSSFKPGFIISDYLFYKKGAMTQAQIQAFLDAKIGTCSNTNCLNVKRVTTTTRAADRTVCAQYTGATNELVSAIIYKTQQACGISAKVLLVTLQKEQSLITAKAPSDAKLQRAMGYGCPDNTNGACNVSFYGLYNQIYKAAWQFKRYSTPDPWGTFQPGVRNIQYHPKVACGTKRVVITNNATAALYNYTPYTPNAASLANIGTTGDTCSSYGNRNFWAYYTNWFGSTLAGAGDESVAAAYVAGGGASAFGAAVSAPTCGLAATCTKTYAQGVIHWSLAGGAFTVLGDIAENYIAKGGVSSFLGAPIAAVATITGPQGDGKSQTFKNGQIVSSSSGVFSIAGTVKVKHAASGWVRGDLGWPTAEQTCTSGNCSQEFQGGLIAHVKGKPAFVVSAGEFATKYAAEGGLSGVLGYPSADAVAITGPHGNGTSQAFVGGQIVSSTHGTFALTGAIKARHAQLKWVRGDLGWPTEDAVCTSGNCSQKFQFGSITVNSNGTVAVSIVGPIDTKYQSAGGKNGALGAATGSVVAITSPHGNGLSQAFTNGQIVSSANGTWILTGAIRTEHAAQKWVRGALGWPTADQVCSSGACSQTFQFGTIAVSASGAIDVSDSGPIGVKHRATGGSEGPLGAAVGAIVEIASPHGNGLSRAFANGQIVSSAQGTWVLSGVIRSKHAELKWVRGTLGWPVADQTCVEDLCAQSFQFGTITVFPNGAVVVADHASVAAKYAAMGGKTGSLGATAGKVVTIYGPNGNGLSQAFANGQIVSSASGAFVLTGAIRTKHAELLWVRGTLGWPTADQVCSAGECSQQFQLGKISVVGSTVTVTY